MPGLIGAIKTAVIHKYAQMAINRIIVNANNNNNYFTYSLVKSLYFFRVTDREEMLGKDGCSTAGVAPSISLK